MFVLLPLHFYLLQERNYANFFVQNIIRSLNKLSGQLKIALLVHYIYDGSDTQHALVCHNIIMDDWRRRWT